MTEIKQKILGKTASKNSPPVSNKQKAQNTQAGGPTIGGVAGVGKQKTVTRPNSSRRPSVVHGHTTGPSPTGIGEGKESEYLANRQLQNTVKSKMQHKLNPKNKGGGDDYFSYNAKKTNVKEDVAMSVGGGAVAGVAPADATTNYAFQIKKKIKKNSLERHKK